MKDKGKGTSTGFTPRKPKGTASTTKGMLPPNESTHKHMIDLTTASGELRAIKAVSDRVYKQITESIPYWADITDYLSNNDKTEVPEVGGKIGSRKLSTIKQIPALTGNIKNKLDIKQNLNITSFSKDDFTNYILSEYETNLQELKELKKVDLLLREIDQKRLHNEKQISSDSDLGKEILKYKADFFHLKNLSNKFIELNTIVAGYVPKKEIAGYAAKNQAAGYSPKKKEGGHEPNQQVWYDFPQKLKDLINKNSQALSFNDKALDEQAIAQIQKQAVERNKVYSEIEEKCFALIRDAVDKERSSTPDGVIRNFDNLNRQIANILRHSKSQLLVKGAKPENQDEENVTRLSQRARSLLEILEIPSVPFYATEEPISVQLDSPGSIDTLPWDEKITTPENMGDEEQEKYAVVPREEINELQKINENLKETLAQVIGDTDLIHTKYEEVEQNNGLLGKMLEQKNAENAQLIEENQGLSDRNTALDATVSKAQQENANLQAQIQKTTQEIAEIRAGSETVANTNNELKDKIDKAQKEIATLKEENLGITQKNTELEEQLQSAKHENGQNTQVNAHLTSEVASLQRRFNVVREENEKVQASNVLFIKENNLLQDLVQKVQEEQALKVKQNKTLKDENDQLKEAATAASQNIDKLNLQNNDLQTQINEAQKTNESLAAENELAKQENKNLKGQIQQQQEENNTFKVENENLLRKFAEAEQTALETQDSIDKLTTVQRQLEEAVSSQAVEIETLQAENAKSKSENQVLQSTVEQVQQENTQKTKENTKLQAAVMTAQQENENLTKQNNALTEKVNTAQEEQTKLVADNEVLMQKNADLQHQVSQNNVDNDALKNKIANIQIENDDLKGKVEEKTQQFSNDQQIIKNLKRLRDQQDERLTEAQELNQELQVLLQKQDEAANIARVENQGFKQALQKASEENAELQTTVITAQQENEDLKVQNKGLMEAVENAKAANAGLAEAQEKAQQENVNLQEQVRTFEAEIKTITTESAAINEENDRLKQAVEQAQQESARKTEENAQLQTTVITAQQKNEDLKVQNKELAQDVERVRAEIETVRTESTEVKEANEQLKKAVEQAREENAQKTEENAQLKTTVTTVHQENEDLKVQNKDLAQDVERVRAEIETVRTESTEVKEANEQLKKAVEQAREENAQKTEENAQLQTTVITAQQKNEDLKEQNKGLIAEVENAKAANVKLAEENTKQSEENAQLVEANEALVKANAGLTAKVAEVSQDVITTEEKINALTKNQQIMEEDALSKNAEIKTLRDEVEKYKRLNQDLKDEVKSALDVVKENEGVAHGINDDLSARLAQTLAENEALREQIKESGAQLKTQDYAQQTDQEDELSIRFNQERLAEDNSFEPESKHYEKKAVPPTQKISSDTLLRTQNDVEELSEEHLNQSIDLEEPYPSSDDHDPRGGGHQPTQQTRDHALDEYQDVSNQTSVGSQGEEPENDPLTTSIDQDVEGLQESADVVNANKTDDPTKSSSPSQTISENYPADVDANDELDVQPEEHSPKSFQTLEDERVRNTTQGDHISDNLSQVEDNESDYSGVALGVTPNLSRRTSQHQFYQSRGDDRQQINPTDEVLKSISDFIMSNKQDPVYLNTMAKGHLETLETLNRKIQYSEDIKSDTLRGYQGALGLLSEHRNGSAWVPQYCLYKNESSSNIKQMRQDIVSSADESFNASSDLNAQFNKQKKNTEGQVFAFHKEALAPNHGRKYVLMVPVSQNGEAQTVVGGACYEGENLFDQNRYQQSVNTKGNKSSDFVIKLSSAQEVNKKLQEADLPASADEAQKIIDAASVASVLQFLANFKGIPSPENPIKLNFNVKNQKGYANAQQIYNALLYVSDRLGFDPKAVKIPSIGFKSNDRYESFKENINHNKELSQFVERYAEERQKIQQASSSIKDILTQAALKASDPTPNSTASEKRREQLSALRGRSQSGTTPSSEVDEELSIRPPRPRHPFC